MAYFPACFVEWMPYIEMCMEVYELQGSIRNVSNPCQGYSICEFVSRSFEAWPPLLPVSTRNQCPDRCRSRIAPMGKNWNRERLQSAAMAREIWLFSICAGAHGADRTNTKPIYRLSVTERIYTTGGLKAEEEGGSCGEKFDAPPPHKMPFRYFLLITISILLMFPKIVTPTLSPAPLPHVGEGKCQNPLSRKRERVAARAGITSD